MNKLTAEKCREIIGTLDMAHRIGMLSIAGERHLMAYRIALPVLEQQERTGDLISTPQHVLNEKLNEHFGAAPMPPTDTYRQIENDSLIQQQINGRTK